ncbi:integrase family protein [Acinetobacter sp. FL51]|uniref:tyrosine-type recombinase/integrase n=1 Tax=Acinetobacter sp. FL51 TaxID=2777978 RepID=UPI0018E1A5A5|nr:integrase family protein [Acinetobacter sp. FL51]MBI1450413.1 integrase family protein [Acinetobacter sp. FL51]
MSLSDSWLKSSNGKVREKVEVVTDRDGLSVRISPKGKIVFQYRYRFDGKAKRLDLGTYPLLGLKDARAKVHKYKIELDQGKDPMQLKLKGESDYLKQLTVNEICDLWFNTIAVNKVSKKDDHRAFEIHVYPKIGRRICDDVSLQEWSELLFEITANAKSVAVKVLGNLRMILRWGCIHGKLKHQPIQHLRASDLNVKKVKRTRYLSEQEIFWVVHSSLRSNAISPKNKAIIIMLLFYGCRVSELRLAKKSDFDFREMIWCIPPENHKMGDRTHKPIIRPIIPQIVPFIQYVFSLSPDSCEYAFPNLKGKVYTKLEKSFQTTIPSYVNENVRKRFDVQMQHWTMHDLRRTMRTHISELAPPHICEIMLGHGLPAVWGTYDLHEYLEEQAQAYEKWFHKLCAILNNHERFDIKGCISSDSSNPLLLSQASTALMP